MWSWTFCWIGDLTRRQARRHGRPSRRASAEGLLAAHAVTTIHYLVRKEMDATKARRIISAILRVFGVAAVDGAVIQEALQLSCSDFENAVTAAAARLAGCECIVTRDPRGFRGSPVRSVTPEMVTPLLGKE